MCEQKPLVMELLCTLMEHIERKRLVVWLVIFVFKDGAFKKFKIFCIPGYFSGFSDMLAVSITQYYLQNYNYILWLWCTECYIVNRNWTGHTMH